MSKTLIFAHRGANKEAAENTRTAFDKALAYPIDGIETDVQLSRDEVAVLWHDRDLKKLKLPGKHIDDFDYAQLQAMNFAAHFAGIGCARGRDESAGIHCGLSRALPFAAGDQEPRLGDASRGRNSRSGKTLGLVGAVTDDRIMVSSFNLGQPDLCASLRAGSFRWC